MKTLKIIEYIEYVTSFLKVNNVEVGDKTYQTPYGVDAPYFNSYITHHSTLPLDSFDRIYALYLLDTYPNIVEEFNVETYVASTSSEDTTEYIKGLLGQDLWDAFCSLPTSLAYENYEREYISPSEGLANILHVAREGHNATLTDSYANGGWFGAS